MSPLRNIMDDVPMTNTEATAIVVKAGVRAKEMK